MRHIGRTHKICHMWLHEQLTQQPAVSLEYCDTALMAADIFTKAFTDVSKWKHALSLIGIAPRTTEVV